MEPWRVATSTGAKPHGAPGAGAPGRRGSTPMPTARCRGQLGELGGNPLEGFEGLAVLGLVGTEQLDHPGEAVAEVAEATEDDQGQAEQAAADEVVELGVGAEGVGGAVPAR